MDVQVTVKIPEHVYRQARRAAAYQRRTLDEVLNEALTSAFPAVHIHPQRARMEEEMAAFEHQKNQLLAQYADQYVAIYRGAVVDSDSEIVPIAARIEERYPDEIVLIKQVSAEPDRDLVVRSPRLVD